MSQVVVNVEGSDTTVSVSETSVDVNVTETSATVEVGFSGAQGAAGSNGVGYSGITSTSTITIGSGLKTFSLVGSNQGAFVTGMRVRAIHSDTPTYFMEGTANYIGGGTLIITVDKFNGSGSHNSWTFAIAGEVGQTGSTGATGATGSSGVVSVTAPITNAGSAGSAVIGIDQSALSITRSQVSNFTSGSVAYATSAGSASTAGAASTAGTASYATTSGTAVYGSTSGTAVYSSTSGTAVYASNAGTAVSISGSVAPSQVSGTAVVTSDSRLSDARTPTAHASSHASAGSDPVTLAQSQVTGLTSALNAKAPLASPSFTGTVGIPTANINNLNVGNQSTQTITLGNETIGGILPGLIVKGNGNIDGDFNLADFYAKGSSVQAAYFDPSGYLYVPITSSTPQSLATAINAKAALTATQTFTGTQTLIPSAVGVQSLIVKAITSQTANMMEWQSNTGSILARIDANGVPIFTRAVYANDNSISSIGLNVKRTINQIGTVATEVGLILKGAASQSADMLQIQNSAGTTNGVWYVNGDISASSGYAKLLTANSGATLQLTKMTAATGNPGAGIGRLYFRDGTNAGTLKLVVRAGAAGAETTILDNIPQ